MEMSSRAKPTLWTLWNFEAEALEEQAVAMTGLHPLVVAAAVVGCEVPREDFEKVLHTVCAVRRVVISLLQAGGIEEVFLGYQSTWMRKLKGTRAD